MTAPSAGRCRSTVSKSGTTEWPSIYERPSRNGKAVDARRIRSAVARKGRWVSHPPSVQREDDGRRLLARADSRVGREPLLLSDQYPAQRRRDSVELS